MVSKKICILDYGSGNIGSVCNILQHLGYKTKISNSKRDIIDSTHIILPGVGAFSSAMKKINEKIPIDTLENEVFKGKPFLGICVGMQVLAEEGHEFNLNNGLGWIKGKVIKFDTSKVKVPHVGWNDLKIIKETKLFKNHKDILDFYFVHSYFFELTDHSNLIAECDYGNYFPSVINRDNIFGVQFHPEKSQLAGQLLLKNFVEEL